MVGGGVSIFNPGEVEASCGRNGRGGGKQHADMIFISDKGQEVLLKYPLYYLQSCSHSHFIW